MLEKEFVLVISSYRPERLEWLGVRALGVQDRSMNNLNQLECMWREKMLIEGIMLSHRR